MLLTKRQQNQLLGAISERGHDVSIFRLQNMEVSPTVGFDQVDVIHDASRSAFSVWHYGNRLELFTAKMVIGGAEWNACNGVRWPAILIRAADWTDEVKYEIEAPDLWAEVLQAAKILEAAQAPGASNAPFTADEQAVIVRRIDEAKQLVEEKPDLADVQKAAISQGLDYAKESRGRLGRKDWLLMFYGGVISTGINDAVPPGVVQTVLATVLHGLGHLFGFGGPPPIITS